MANDSPTTAAPTASKPLAVGNGVKEARNEFVREVARAIDRLVTENGCSRLRATKVLLREICGDTCTPQPEEKLNHTKLHYRVSHSQAYRALSVSCALQRILQSNRLSHAAAIQQLTRKLASANFSDAAVQIDGEPAAVVALADSPLMRKKSEISLPGIPKTSTTQQQSTNEAKQQQPTTRRAKSPLKRGKTPSSVAASSSKAPKQKQSSSTRKRSIDELGGGNNNPQQQSNPKTRSRSDSVTEEMTAKMEQQQQQTGTGNAEKSVPAVGARNNKRVRGSSMEEVDGPPVVSVKRTRTG